MARRYAILIDGGFTTKKLQARVGHFPTDHHIVELCANIRDHVRLKGASLFRIFFYDADPLGGSVTNPLDGYKIEFANSRVAKQNRRLHDALELRPDFAVRRGELVFQGWKLGTSAMRDLASNGARELEGRDLVPNVHQKGVDLCMGLDIAGLAFRKIVDTIVVVTGDSDLIPALKMARIEGLRVFLETLGHGVRRELKVHVDVVLGCKVQETQPNKLA